MPSPWSYRLALFATGLAFIVVVLGAYTRLTDAGLGCPDWPGCYGQLTPPSSVAGMDAKKAWTEMAHRYLAGLLGLTILTLALLAIRHRHSPKQPLVLPLFLVVLLVFQAALGMWTVTLKLYPLVVVAHLLGGLTSLSLLWWLSLKLKPLQIAAIEVTKLQPSKLQNIRILAGVGLAILIIQLFLGGWTSANYAALVCLEFPYCQAGQFFPTAALDQSSWFSAFNLITAGVSEGFGQPLDIHARMVIHMVHRLTALLITFLLGGLAIQIFRSLSSPLLRKLTGGMIVLLITQLLLGVSNILAILPLPIALAHNAVAAVLLLTLVTLNYILFLIPAISGQKKYG